MKLEWMPYGNLQAPGVGLGLEQVWKVDDPNDVYELGTGSSNTSLVSAPDFKNIRPVSGWKRFYSFKKLSKQMNVPW